eukprot:5456125-Pyramimonas_sp.AAC.1
MSAPVVAMSTPVVAMFTPVVARTMSVFWWIKSTPTGRLASHLDLLLGGSVPMAYDCQHASELLLVILLLRLLGIVVVVLVLALAGNAFHRAHLPSSASCASSNGRRRPTTASNGHTPRADSLPKSLCGK